MTAIETIKLDWDVIVEIHPDEEPMNPRTDWDNYTTMVCWHQRANLGDRTIDTRDFDDYAELLAWIEAEYSKPVLVQPLWLYEHGNMTIRTGDGNPFGDPWDSGQVGLIFTTQKQMDECGATDAKLLLEGDVRTYDQYLTGDIYGFVVKRHGEVLESCWGFYGSDEALSEGKDTGEHCVREVVQTMVNEDNAHQLPWGAE